MARRVMPRILAARSARAALDTCPPNGRAKSPARVLGIALLAGWLIATTVLLSYRSPAVQAAAGPQRLRVQVLASYPHDAKAFTQGLELSDDQVLYEGTGRYGQSEIRDVESATGTVRKRVALPGDVFGEGITVVGSRLWQLSWQENVAFLRDRDTLAEVRRARYSGEGWGLCHDETRDRLVMSDGSAKLTFRDPRTFAAMGTVAVTLNGTPQDSINELECVDGMVWANLWFSDDIVRIDPATGVVDTVVDASGLLTDAEQAEADVLNGIAAVPNSDTFFLTGKLWPRMFHVAFVDKEPS